MIADIIISLGILLGGVHLVWSSYGKSDLTNKVLEGSAKTVSKYRNATKEDIINYYKKWWRIGGYSLIILSLIHIIFVVLQ